VSRWIFGRFRALKDFVGQANFLVFRKLHRFLL
jgi:hypothetical protein